MNNEIDFISKKKPLYPISSSLMEYLKEYSRVDTYDIKYEDLDHYQDTFPIIDQFGNDSLWQGLMYQQTEYKELEVKMINLYVLLKAGGDFSINEHLKLDRIDYCTFGNTKPFRVKIMNRLNDNHDYFYIKKIDASRVYGLELEHLLSPNRINYLANKNTIIEEHIPGIPGDQFVNNNLPSENSNKVRIAKEFVKFNERCFVRLLGDMRSYNYVIDITPDFDNEQYRIRSIDFDQQNFEGKKSIYLPQYLKENKSFVSLCMELLSPKSVSQYQKEERSLMRRRARSSSRRLLKILKCMKNDKIFILQKQTQLKTELAAYMKNETYLATNSMGELLKKHLEVCLEIEL